MADEGEVGLVPVDVVGPAVGAAEVDVGDAARRALVRDGGVLDRRVGAGRADDQVVDPVAVDVGRRHRAAEVLGVGVPLDLEPARAVQRAEVQRRRGAAALAEHDIDLAGVELTAGVGELGRDDQVVHAVAVEVAGRAARAEVDLGRRAGKGEAVGGWERLQLDGRGGRAIGAEHHVGAAGAGIRRRCADQQVVDVVAVEVAGGHRPAARAAALGAEDEVAVARIEAGEVDQRSIGGHGRPPDLRTRLPGNASALDRGAQGDACPSATAQTAVRCVLGRCVLDEALE